MAPRTHRLELDRTGVDGAAPSGGQTAEGGTERRDRRPSWDVGGCTDQGTLAWSVLGTLLFRVVEPSRAGCGDRPEGWHERECAVGDWTTCGAVHVTTMAHSIFAVF